MNYTVEELIAKYVALRDSADAMKDELKVKLEPIEKALDAISGVLMKISIDTGVNSFKTVQGTAFKAKKTYVGIGNWDETLPYILSSGNHQMLKKDVAKKAVEEYIEAHGSPPPGINYTVEWEMQVRRPSK